MIRTQVYLTDTERKKLLILAGELGTSQSELIRKAIDEFILNKSTLDTNRLAMLQAAKGLWSQRDDLPDFANLRNEFNERDKT